MILNAHYFLATKSSKARMKSHYKKEIVVFRRNYTVRFSMHPKTWSESMDLKLTCASPCVASLFIALLALGSCSSTSDERAEKQSEPSSAADWVQSVADGEYADELARAQGMLEAALTPEEWAYLNSARWLDIDPRLVASDPILLKALAALEPWAADQVALGRFGQVSSALCSTDKCQFVFSVVGGIWALESLATLCTVNPPACVVTLLAGIALGLALDNKAHASDVIPIQPADFSAYQQNVDPSFVPNCPKEEEGYDYRLCETGFCVNVLEVRQHCGECGRQCPGYQNCHNGVCIDDSCVPKCDDQKCGSDGCGGSCGPECGDGLACYFGECLEDCSLLPSCLGEACNGYPEHCLLN